MVRNGLFLKVFDFLSPKVREQSFDLLFKGGINLRLRYLFPGFQVTIYDLNDFSLEQYYLPCIGTI